MGLSVPFLFLMITHRLDLDFWLDEMMSIIRHIKPSVRSIIFSYPAPNNHVFSNLLSNIYLRLIGIRDLKLVLENPYILRLPYFLSGLLAVYVTAYTAHKHIGKWAGYITVILFTTTIPLANFLAQVRGYSFSILFSSLLVLSTLEYEKTESWQPVVSIILSSFLLLYTIPSNIYFVLGMVLYFVFREVWSGSFFRVGKLSVRADQFSVLGKGKTVIFSLGVGMVMAVLFYLPVIRRIINNKYVLTEGLFQGTVFQTVLKGYLQHVISGRLGITLVAMLGLIWLMVQTIGEKDRAKGFLIHYNLMVFFLPFVVSFIRGDDPFERTFLVSLPSLILIAVLGIDHVLEKLAHWFSSEWRLHTVLLGGLFLIMNGSFLSVHQGIRKEISENLHQEQIEQVEYHDQRMWASHFLEHYHILPIIHTAEKNNQDLPFYLDEENTRYPWVMIAYFQEFGYPIIDFTDPITIEEPQGYVVVSYAEESTAEIKQSFPGAECSFVDEDVSIYRVLSCQFFDPN